ncbi:MAG: fluoride efflux transporter CrcB [Chloroherpetonaceae bacterium]|nr:fluoride efflux transporter CrcB [Chthonomonadaceae bacterium]MDW8208499.1 fluoride efflux transporter CrcB [Chloroherpetonaceae bacterium]
MLHKCLIVGLGGFFGANARYLLGVWAGQRWGTDFPYGTLIINITGCFLLGLFATLALRFVWSDQWRLLIAIGFLGAYTTFSTFEYETLQLVAEGSWARALANVLISVSVGFLAAYLGVALGRLGATVRL